MGKQRVRLVWKMLVDQPRRALYTLIVAILLTMIAASLGTFFNAHNQVQIRQARASFGSYAQRVSGNENVKDYLRELESNGKAVAVIHSRANILARQGQTDDAATTADVTYLSGQGDMGMLIAGNHPASAGEVAVSSEVARLLDIELGGDIALADLEGEGKNSPATFRVVGIIENPASIRDHTVIAVTDSTEILGRADSWLTDDPLMPLADELGQGQAQVATPDRVAHRASENAIAYQVIPAYVAWFVGVFVVCAVVFAVFAADRQRRRSVHNVLRSLGESPFNAAFHASLSTGLTMVIGGMIGWTVTQLIVAGSAERVGVFYEERWTGPFTADVAQGSVVLLLLFVLATFVSAAATLFAHRWQRRDYYEELSYRKLGILGVCGLAVTAVFIACRQLYILPWGHQLALVSGALSIPALGYYLALAFQRRTIFAKLSARLHKVALVALGLVFVTSYSAALFSSAVALQNNWITREIAGEDSYLQVAYASKASVVSLKSRFPEIATQTSIFGEPENGERMYRLVTLDGADCLDIGARLDKCNRIDMDGVFLASGNMKDRDFVNHAPAHMVSPDGKVVVVEFSASDPTVTNMWVVDNVIPDEKLSNNVFRGLILAPDDPLVSQIGLTDPSLFRITIFGFGELSDDIRDGVRSTILTQAPFAFVTDPDAPEDRQLRAEAITRVLVALLTAGIVLCSMTIAIVSDQAIERRLIDLGGGGIRARVRLIAPLLGSYVVTVAAAAVMGRLVVMDRLPFTPAIVHHDYGLLWIVVLVSILFALPALHWAVRKHDPVRKG
ncbi:MULTISPECIES: hypothetical protein [Actinotignum]|uniref:ABC transporter permease n=1 Tax=Actinotignum timonense TaxID=1870995 RepID=A0AAW9HRJ7_9ACTO|nr:MULTISPECIES: hypothetical protein [Actinotignum]MDE1559130.1 hypothetical protein [Actinotignum schaalii]MDE1664141.1 hypothetical protein [Actinotignum schaalii]MDK6373801.1 hypothetical protein [Actinotignum timonense]MDK6419429.1 hypothetical protein [Actinotignum timonense]MDK6590750.1 hypothetical protein [Actinotignum timonense]